MVTEPSLMNNDETSGIVLQGYASGRFEIDDLKTYERRRAGSALPFQEALKCLLRYKRLPGQTDISDFLGLVITWIDWDY